MSVRLRLLLRICKSHCSVRADKSRTPESGRSAGSRTRDRSAAGATQKKRRRYLWTRLFFGHGGGKQVDNDVNDMEMPVMSAPTSADVGSGNVRAVRRGEHDTVFSNAAATTARAGGESSRQRPQHHYEAIPADLIDRQALAEKEIPLRPSSHRRRHSIGAMTTSSDTSTVGDLANVNVNGAAILYGLGPAARSGRSRRPLMQRQVSHEAQICPRPVAADAQVNQLSDPAMVRSYAASVDSDGQIHPYATFANTLLSKTAGRRGVRDQYNANERTGSRNYSGRTDQSEQQLRAADMASAAMANQQRPVAVRGVALASNRPAPPKRLASTSSTGTTTVNDQIQLVRSTFLMTRDHYYTSTYNVLQYCAFAAYTCIRTCTRII